MSATMSEIFPALATDYLTFIAAILSAVIAKREQEVADV